CRDEHQVVSYAEDEHADLLPLHEGVLDFPEVLVPCLVGPYLDGEVRHEPKVLAGWLERRDALPHPSGYYAAGVVEDAGIPHPAVKLEHLKAELVKRIRHEVNVYLLLVRYKNFDARPSKKLRPLGPMCRILILLCNPF